MSGDPHVVAFWLAVLVLVVVEAVLLWPVLHGRWRLTEGVGEHLAASACLNVVWTMLPTLLLLLLTALTAQSIAMTH